jgi:hypothetical protein
MQQQQQQPVLLHAKKVEVLVFVTFPKVLYNHKSDSFYGQLESSDLHKCI